MNREFVAINLCYNEFFAIKETPCAARREIFRTNLLGTER